MTAPTPFLDQEALLHLLRTDPEQVPGLFLTQRSLLFEKIRLQEEQIRILLEKIQELEKRLNRNRQNRSKPPSSDGDQSPRPKSPSAVREEAGMSARPQRGALCAVTNPDRVVDVPVRLCPCGGDLSWETAIDFELRQVFDLHEPRLFVTEYRLAKVFCPSCRLLAGSGRSAPTSSGPF
jgi:hypothetical protein